MKNKSCLVLMLSISTLVFGMDKSEKKVENPIEKILWLGYKTTHRKYEFQQPRTVLEIAALVTDMQLQTIAESDSLVIHAQDWILEYMYHEEKQLTEEYTKSGLLEKVRASQLTISQAEAALLAFINNHFPNSNPKTFMKDHWNAGSIVTHEMEALAKRIGIQRFGFGISQWAKAWDETGVYTQSTQPTSKEEARDLLGELQHYKQRYFDSVKEAK